MLYKPFIALGEWGLALPSGGVKPGEDIRDAARCELKKETGLIAGTLLSIGEHANHPDRTATRDSRFIAINITLGDMEREPGEKAMVTMVFSIPQVVDLLDHGKIIGAGPQSALYATLRMMSPPVRTAFDSLRGA